MEKFRSIIMLMMLVSFHQALSQQKFQDSVGTFNLINAYGLCLASDGNWGDNGNNLVQWECLPEIGQRWSYNNSNLFGSDRRICNDFMKCIKAVPGESRLVQYDPDDRDVQQFTLVPSHRNGYWYIMNDDGNCLSSSSNTGNLVTLTTCTYHSPMQMWKRLKLNPQGSFSMPIVDPLTFPTDFPLKLPTEFPQFNPLFLSPLPHFSSSSSLPTSMSPTNLPETTTSATPVVIQESSILPTPTLTVIPTTTALLSTWIPPWAFLKITSTPLPPKPAELTYSFGGLEASKTSEPSTWIPAWAFSPSSVLAASTVSPTAAQPSPTEEPINEFSSSIPTPHLWVLFGPIDLNNSAFWPFNLPQFESYLPLFYLKHNLPFSEKL